jgi:hypothetical protein
VDAGKGEEKNSKRFCCKSKSAAAFRFGYFSVLVRMTFPYQMLLETEGRGI